MHYQIKIGRKLFRWVFFYKTKKATTDLAAAYVFEKEIKGKIPPSQLRLFLYDGTATNDVLINGKKVVRLIKLDA